MNKEPEEVLEGALVAAIGTAVASLDVPVDGFLTPAADGVAKFAAGTTISVVVDVSKQNAEYKAANAFAFSALVAVRVAKSDDKTGARFRDICRAVRSVLTTFSGDGCADLTNEIGVDAVLLNSTQTTLDDSVEGGATRKTYDATITGRVIQQQPEEAQ